MQFEYLFEKLSTFKKVQMTEIIATIQGRQSRVVYPGLVLLSENYQSHNHHMSRYNIELLHTYCHNPGQGRAGLFKLDWYSCRKVPPPHHIAIYSMFVTGRQQVFAHSSGLKDFYDLKHVAFFHFVRVILI